MAQIQSIRLATAQLANLINIEQYSFGDYPTLEQFRNFYCNDDICMRALFHAKWPNGYSCPRCSNRRYFSINRRRLPLFECSSCGHQTSLTVGTILEKSRTSLMHWFQALYLHSQPEGISATSLMTIIGTTYKTAWLICHKIRHAMMQTDANERLSGVVRMNCAQYGRPYNPTIYRHSQEHPLLIGASFDNESVVTYLKIKQIPKPHLYEDIVTPFGRDAFIHEHVDSNNATVTSVIKKYSPQRNRQLLALSRQATGWINEVFCGIGAKHLQAYLDQFSFLFNLASYRKPAFQTLLSCCASTRTSTYSMIVNKPPEGVQSQPVNLIYPQLAYLSNARISS